MTNCLSVADLWGGKFLATGEIPLSISNNNSYDENYFIDRNVTHQTTIKDDVLNDKKHKKLCGLLDCTEQQLDKLCQQDRKRNVHWLHEDKLGNLFGSKGA